MTPTAPLISQHLAERFAKAFDAFVSAVRAAVAEGILNPAYSSTPEFLTWQTEALPRLEQELLVVQNAFALFLIGETGTIAQVADYQSKLARHLDGFSLDFVGADKEKALHPLETAVVIAAYQVCQAAGLP